MRYKFSIIMSVYNVEEFFEEAINSIIYQSIGLKNIQIILVDDGSTDGSGKLCDKYKNLHPENIVVVHKNNGGLSSARNLGMKYVDGEYFNFFDPDDKLSKNTLKNVYKFFKKHEDEIQMVSIPLFYFDAKTGEHPTNRGKFNHGNRIIDLSKDYTLIHNSVASSFFKNELKDKIYFDEKLWSMEDAKAIIKFLVKSQKYGVVSNAKYFYRQRTSGFVSLSHKNERSKEWYTYFLNRFYFDIFDYCKKTVGYLPRFVQAVFLYDIQWKIKQEKLPSGVLSKSENEEYFSKLKEVIKLIDDDVIRESPYFSDVFKNFFKTIKSENLLELYKFEFLKKSSFCKLDFLKIENEISFDYTCFLLSDLLKTQSIKPIVIVNDQKFYATEYVRKCDVTIAGNSIYKGICAKVSLPKDVFEKQENIICFCLEIGKDEFIVPNLQFGKYSPVSSYFKTQFYSKNDFAVSVCDNKILVQKSTKKLLKHKNKAFLRELLHSEKIGAKKAFVVLQCYKLLKSFNKNKNIWLLSDRIDRADDNGECLFKYLKTSNFAKENNIKFYFVIDKNLAKTVNGKNVVQAYSFKHKLLHLLADIIISSQADNYIFRPIYEAYECYRDVCADKKFVFLQHGVTKDDISDWINKYTSNFSAIVTTGKSESESFIKTPTYFFDKSEIWEIGFTRFDYLESNPEKMITIMPTWRKYLFNGLNPQNGEWYIDNTFTDSQYFKFYNGLLNNKKLIECCKKHGYKLCFMPHPIIMKHIDLFDKNENVCFFDENAKYSYIYEKSALVLTDYSSAVFDFAYLGKPIIYAQFDQNEFFGGNHAYSKGYFDYKKDGFGEIANNLEATINLLISYIQNDCKIKDEYKKRIDKFFAYRDHQNCERTCNKLTGKC